MVGGSLYHARHGGGKMDNLLPTIRCLVREHRVPPERAIRLLTQNVADGLCLSRKGRLTVGADADVLLVDRDWKITSFKKEKYHHVRLALNGAEAVSERITSPEEAEALRVACA